MSGLVTDNFANFYFVSCRRSETRIPTINATPYTFKEILLHEFQQPPSKCTHGSLAKLNKMIKELLKNILSVFCASKHEII